MNILASVISCLNTKDQKHKVATLSDKNSVAAVIQTSFKPEVEQPVLVEGAEYLAKLITKTRAMEDTFGAAVASKFAKQYNWVSALPQSAARKETSRFSVFKMESVDDFFHFVICGEFEVRILSPDGSSTLISDALTYANIKKHFDLIGRQISNGCLPSTDRFKNIVRSLDDVQSSLANTDSGSNFLFAHKEIPFRPSIVRIKKDAVSRVMVSSYSLAGIWESYEVSPGPMELLNTPSQEDLTSLIFDLRKKERIDGFLSQYPRAAVNPTHLCMIVDCLSLPPKGRQLS